MILKLNTITSSSVTLNCLNINIGINCIFYDIFILIVYVKILYQAKLISVDPIITSSWI